MQQFYKGVRARSKQASTSNARLRLLLDLYENFFAKALPEKQDQLGIVYTPEWMVDFILRSADAVCRAEFGKGLTDEGVQILDPFTGTGTFIYRLLTQRSSDQELLIRDEDLFRKYKHELHANEIVPLAYYIAAIKIEEGYRERALEAPRALVEQSDSDSFDGIVLTDTFYASDITTTQQQFVTDVEENYNRRKKQKSQPIKVIVANPPWSAGQKSTLDENPNLKYDEIAERIRDTYGRKQKEVTGRTGSAKAFGNLFVKAFRWASDRLGESGDNSGPGIIAFIHPNSLLNGTSLAGMRAQLREEFTGIYVINLRGDAYKSGAAFLKEGAKLFGGGSRSGVQITVLARNPERDQDAPAVLRYTQVEDGQTIEGKKEWLENLGDVTSDQLKPVPVNDSHDWVNLTDGTFNGLLTVCSTDKKASETAIKTHTLGLTTACDMYVYSFSREALIDRMKRLIWAYENARIKHRTTDFTLEEVTRNTEQSRGEIKWTDRLKQSLKSNHKLTFDESRIRKVLYRPFTKLWMYEDDKILSSVKTVSAMFPRGGGGMEYSSQLRTTETAAQSLPPQSSWTSTSSVQTKAGFEHYQDGGNPDHFAHQPDDLRSAGSEQSPRPSQPRPGPARDFEAGNQQLDQGGGGGDRYYLANQPDDLRSAGNEYSPRPLRRRDQSAPSSHTETEAILTNNQWHAAGNWVLATEILPDLGTVKGTNGSTRAMPRWKP